jgi:hypothetical protein
MPEPVRGDMLTAATIQSVNTYEWTVDPFTEKTTRQACAELSDYIVRLANEPSLGLHHVTTHIHHKAVPRMNGARDSLQEVTREAEAAAYDVSDSTRTVRAMHELVALKHIKDDIARSIMMVEQMLNAPPGGAPRPAASTPGRPATPQSPAEAGGGTAATPQAKASEGIAFKSF